METGKVRVLLDLGDIALLEVVGVDQEVELRFFAENLAVKYLSWLTSLLSLALTILWAFRPQLLPRGNTPINRNTLLGSASSRAGWVWEISLFDLPLAPGVVGALPPTVGATLHGAGSALGTFEWPGPPNPPPSRTGFVSRTRSLIHFYSLL